MIAFAAAVAVWEMSRVVRACMGAFSRIYDCDDDRSWRVRPPLSIGIGIVLTVSLVGAVVLATAANGAVGGVWGLACAVVLTTYAFVASIVLLVGIQVDELLRREVEGEEERGILQLVRGAL